jgi:uncharacterized membrane protein
LTSASRSTTTSKAPVCEEPPPAPPNPLGPTQGDQGTASETPEGEVGPSERVKEEPRAPAGPGARSAGRPRRPRWFSRWFWYIPSRAALARSVKQAPTEARASIGDLRTWIRSNRRELVILSVAMVVFTAVLGWLQYDWYLNFNTSGSDLGTYSQAFSTTVQYHDFFRATNELEGGSNGFLFSAHVVPFFFLLLPLYAVVPGAPTLLVIKQAGIALAAVPLYALARERTGSKNLGLFLGLAFLVSPLTMQIDWNDFDPESFLPLATLLLFFLYTRRRFWPMVGATVLTFAVIETAVPTVALFFGTCALVCFYRRSSEPAASRSFVYRATLVVAALSLAWEVMAYVVLLHFSSGGGTFGSDYAARYAVLGATSLPGVVPAVFLHPVNAWAALNYDASLKLEFVAGLLLAVSFLPLVGELAYLVPSAVFLFTVGLADLQNFYSFGNQYAGYVIPFFWAGAIGGIVRIQTWTRRRSGEGARLPPRGRRLRSPSAAVLIPAAVLLAGIVVTAPLLCPLVASPAWEPSTKSFGPSQITAESTLLARVVGMVPSGASVLTTAHICPQLSDRPDLFRVPTTNYFARGNTMESSLQSFINQSRYALFDYALDPTPTTTALYFGNFSGFGVEVSDDSVLLLARGWTTAPVLWAPASADSAGGSLFTVNATVDTENQTSLGPTLYHSPGTPAGRLWEGSLPQGRNLLPGKYNVTFWLKVQTNTTGRLLDIAIFGTDVVVSLSYFVQTSNGFFYTLKVVPTSTINGEAWDNASFQPTSGFEGNISLSLTITQPTRISSLGNLLNDTASVRLYTVDLMETAPLP